MTSTSVDRFSAIYFAHEGARAFALAGLGSDIVYNAARGLRYVLQLTDHEEVTTLPELSVKRLLDAATCVVPTLALQIDEALSAERAGIGMGAAMGLIALFGKPREHVVSETTLPMMLDRIDHVALFAAQLEIISRRESIEARGDVLRRAVQLRQFFELNPADDSQFN